jgi:hypothetical protein
MDFNYEKAYCEIAFPAFGNLSNEHKNIHYLLRMAVAEKKQNRQLLIPITEEREILKALSCKEIAEMARASYFAGHWRPSLMGSAFDNKNGESWKVANVCDQILRERLTPPHNIQIHEGKFRVTFSNKDCWLWDEFGLATEKNLEIFKTCGLPFGERTIDESAKKLKEMCGDMWPDVDTLPDGDLYRSLLELKKEKARKDIEKNHVSKLEGLKQKAVEAELELKAFGAPQKAEQFIDKERSVMIFNLGISLRWLIEHDIDIDNCIYYSHLKEFCFGWREKITEQERGQLIEKLNGFPFEYRFK